MFGGKKRALRRAPARIGSGIRWPQNLEMGGTFDETADVRGDSETIIRKLHAKWSACRQARISDLLARR